MKNTLLTMLSIAMIALSSCAGETAEVEKKMDDTKKMADKAMSKEDRMMTYTVKKGESKVMWKGTMLGVYSHTGTVDVTSGTLVVNGDKVVKGKFSIDMTTMTATDDNYKPEEGKSKEKLIGHLSSPDFFDVSTHPTATLLMDGTKGTLTIRGKQGKVEVKDIKLDRMDGGMHATGKVTFDRSEFGAKYKAAGEAVLSDDVEVEVDLMLKES